MAQITLTFDAIEEKQEALDAINAYEYKAKINEVLEFIRKKRKHDDNVSEDTLRTLQEIIDILEE